MAYNPFYVDPGNDLSQGLSGLSNTFANIREENRRAALLQEEREARARAQARFEEASTAAQQAFETGDPSQIAQVSLQYPEVAEALKVSAGLQTDLQNQAALGFTRALALAAPEDRPALYERRIKEIRDRGGDPSHTEQSYQDYLANPEAETRAVISYWAGIDPKGYQAFADEQKAALEERKLDADIGYKNASLNLRQADLQLKQMDTQLRNLDRQLAQETNDLKRQEIAQRIEIRQQEAQQKRTEAASQARNAVETVDDSLALIDRIKNAPGVSRNFGVWSYAPNVRGGAAADAEAMIDQLRGKAFLQAFESLKGGGQITEVEGKKATQAIANLETSQSEAQFRRGLSELEQILRRAKKSADAQYSKFAAQSAGPGSGGAPAASGGWEIVD